MKHSVLLDTSFFIRLLHDGDPLHRNAIDYFKYFAEKGIAMKVSTISIAEYCVKGTVDELPLRKLQILPFNFDHSKKAGEFAKLIFDSKGVSWDDLKPRAIIPNDTKLFAQADTDQSVTHFVTSDSRCKKVHEILNHAISVKFQIIDISVPYNEVFRHS